MTVLWVGPCDPNLSFWLTNNDESVSIMDKEKELKKSLKLVNKLERKIEETLKSLDAIPDPTGKGKQLVLSGKEVFSLASAIGGVVNAKIKIFQALESDQDHDDGDHEIPWLPDNIPM